MTIWQAEWATCWAAEFLNFLSRETVVFLKESSMLMIYLLKDRVWAEKHSSFSLWAQTIFIIYLWGEILDWKVQPRKPLHTTWNSCAHYAPNNPGQLQSRMAVMTIDLYEKLRLKVLMTSSVLEIRMHILECSVIRVFVAPYDILGIQWTYSISRPTKGQWIWNIFSKKCYHNGMFWQHVWGTGGVFHTCMIHCWG